MANSSIPCFYVPDCSQFSPDLGSMDTTWSWKTDTKRHGHINTNMVPEVNKYYVNSSSSGSISGAAIMPASGDYGYVTQQLPQAVSLGSDNGGFDTFRGVKSGNILSPIQTMTSVEQFGESYHETHLADVVPTMLDCDVITGGINGTMNIDVSNYDYEINQNFSPGGFQFPDACEDCCGFSMNFSPACSATSLDNNWGIQGNGGNVVAENMNILKVGRYTLEERKDKILKYQKKRNQRNFNKTIKYACRKTLADRRVRVRGRFARNSELISEDKKIDDNSPKENQTYCCFDTEIIKNDDDEEWLQEAVASLMYVPFISDH